MNDKFLKFPKVRTFEHVCTKFKGSQSGNIVVFGAKVKLHGTNGAVRIYNGHVTAQKRRADISIEDDNFGFAAWVSSTAAEWGSKNASIVDEAVVIYGEWAGNGIQGGSQDAVELVEPRQFFVFGVRVGAKYFSDPVIITRHVPDIPRVHVIPWLLAPTDERMWVRFSRGETMTKFASYICEAVENVDMEDPYIREKFRICGPGEGIVAVPICVDRSEEITWTQFTNLVFKAKSARHRTKKCGQAARALLVPPDGIDDFVEQFVTDARCAQGVREACDGVLDKKRLKGFYKWVNEDVKQESGMELAAMKCDWKAVSKFVSKAAVAWYLKECKKR